MARKEKDKEIYAPGELDKVRKNIGVIDHEEAKRMSEKLGGEIGYERAAEPEEPKQSGFWRSGRFGSKVRPRSRLELAGDVEEDEDRSAAPVSRPKIHPSDDPSVPQKYSFFERLRIDRYAAQSEFEIKSLEQIVYAMFSIISGEPADYLNPHFVTKRMPEYYRKIEAMTLATRSLLPRNHIRRNERMKKFSPVAFAVLDVIRYWDVEKISSELAKYQAHPKKVKVTDFAEILRAVYRPLFILERLNLDIHIRGAFKILYKALYLENPMEARDKHQAVIRTAVVAYSEVFRNVRFLMYPLLLKQVSSSWLSYDSFFAARRNRIMAFLRVKNSDQLDPAKFIDLSKEDAGEQSPDGEETSEGEDEDADTDEIKDAEPEKELTEEEKAKLAAAESEQRAMERGIQALELLFPKAGWDKLSSYPDLYPYFLEVLDLRRGIVNISPSDPLQQLFVLMRIVEELFFGLRFVSFGVVIGPDGKQEHIAEPMMDIINNWHYYIQSGFEKEYLPGLLEYVRILEGSPEERTGQYARRILSDLHWVKRLYFLPFYKFESIIAPTFQRSSATPVYAQIKKARQYLTAVAASIEQGNKAGGAESDAHCDGIENPWKPYTFQVPNPLSRRLDTLLSGKKKNNANLVYFTLAVIVVLDNLVNNEDSWAYNTKGGLLTRSTGGDDTPAIADTVDADKLFHDSLRNRAR